MVSSRRLLPWCFAALAVAEGTASPQGECDGDADGTCRLSESRGQPPLRWRHRSYKKGKDDGLYGGNYIVGEFGQRFEGPVNDDDWDVLWTSQLQVRDVIAAKVPARPGRLVSQCRYYKAAGQKCYFAGHVRRVQDALRRQNGSSEGFNMLKNYVLTHDAQLTQWREEVLANPSKPWVVKECSAGASTGVKLLHGQALLQEARGKKPEGWVVAQEYLSRPYLGFGGSKFHLRVYVLVTSWGPPAPRIYVYDEGIVFRSRSKYDHQRLDQSRDVFSTLHSGVEAFSHGEFWEELDRIEPVTDEEVATSSRAKAQMMEQIRAVLGVALEETCGKQDLQETQPEHVGFRCFDFFGLDVMFDEELRPFVLEVNSGPNLNIHDRGDGNSELLERVKRPLMGQMVHWAELYVRHSRSGDLDEEAIETKALQNFTRAL